MNKEKKLYELIELFQRIVSKYASFDDMIVELVGVGRPLTKAELHLIKCVKEHPGAIGSELAAILGVTRGAVSQIAAKLAAKGMITREHRNRKELCFALGPSGEEAYRAHEGFHRDHSRELLHSMRLLPSGRIAFIEKVFHEIDGFYDVFRERVTAAAAASSK